MKQHILKQDWDELSDEQNKIFWETVKWNGVTIPKINQYSNQAPNIGQMIQFLGDEWLDDIIVAVDSHRWELLKPEKLCNHLWEAVKFKLHNGKT